MNYKTGHSLNDTAWGGQFPSAVSCFSVSLILPWKQDRPSHTSLGEEHAGGKLYSFLQIQTSAHELLLSKMPEYLV